MTYLIIGLIIFIGIHSISIVALPLRDRLVATNEHLYKAVYALLAFIGLALMAYGYGKARLTPNVIYFTPYWLRHITYLIMLPAMILFLAPYFPGKIKAWTRHPQLLAVILWAIAHLLVNGMLADIILFGGLFVWAILDWWSFRHRPKRHLPQSVKISKFNDIIIILAGILLTGLFIWKLHGLLIGIALIS